MRYGGLCFDCNYDTNPPLLSPNFSQQNLVCENYGGLHTTFQCQPRNQNFDYSNSFGFYQIQPPQQLDNHQLQEIPEVIPFIESKEWIETNNKLYTMMEDFMKRMYQQREQETLIAAQREQELREQELAAQEKEKFKIYSNPLFDDEEIISTKIDSHYFNAESNLIESLLNRDTLIDSSPKFDFNLEEFSGELTHIDPIPPGIEKVDFDLEEE
ncbi:hypothetical protein Tco_0182235, partial [Tanacetum coccineum]